MQSDSDFNIPGLLGSLMVLLITLDASPAPFSCKVISVMKIMPRIPRRWPPCQFVTGVDETTNWVAATWFFGALSV